MAYLLLGVFAYLETVVGPVMPFLRAHLALDYTTASLHFTLFAAGGVLVGTGGDGVIRHAGRGLALWGGLGGMAAGAAALALSPGTAGTLAGAFAMGSFGTLSLVANQAFLADHHGERRTVAIAESNVAASVAAIAAPLAVGGFAGAGWGWQTAPLAAAPVLALLAWRFHGIALSTDRGSKPRPDDDSGLPPEFWILAAVLFVVVSIEWCVAYWGADFLASVVGLGRATAATAMSLFFAAMAVGRLLGARLARRYPGTGLLLVAMGIAAAGFPLFWLAGHPWASLVGLFVAGLGIANFYPLTIAAAATTAPRRSDRAMARLAVSGGCAVLIAPLAVGALADALGLRWGIGIVEPLLLAALATTAAVVRRALRLSERVEAHAG